MPSDFWARQIGHVVVSVAQAPRLAQAHAVDNAGMVERSRMLVMGLGLVMLAVVISRLYSILVDGPPGAIGFAYLGIEAVLGGVFLFWPPPLA